MYHAVRTPFSLQITANMTSDEIIQKLKETTDVTNEAVSEVGTQFVIHLPFVLHSSKYAQFRN